ncbi:hypothetical protein FBZ99_1184 [Rhizobium sp. ERR 1071]|nr:hypothetical protein [Rhizobium sp. ERR1071]TWB08698.1 hypothetical protein FBZ99_1184 [Rhizobium sp. ERR1071]
MEDFRDDYLNRLQPARHSIFRALLADVALMVMAVGTGLTLNFLVA